MITPLILLMILRGFEKQTYMSCQVTNLGSRAKTRLNVILWSKSVAEPKRLCLFIHFLFCF